ncbi:hypothetical protein AAG906_011730 [Vitis piasezkii]
MALLVYVDDVLLASDSILEIERLKTFLDIQTATFPMESTLKLSINDTNFYEDPSYSPILAKPLVCHHQAAIRVLRYLKATPRQEVEYRALATTTCEIQWLLYALQDTDIKHSRSTLLYLDKISNVHRHKYIYAIHFPLRPLFLGVFHQFQILLILNS